MIELDLHKVVCDAQATAVLATAYREHRCAVIPHILGDRLAVKVRDLVASGQWVSHHHGALGREEVMPDSEIVGMLHLIFNDSMVLDIVRAICDQPRISWFGGRIYRFRAGQGHFDHWHNDMRSGRKVGMSLSLSDQPVQGGVFELRLRGENALLASIAAPRFGTATLFEIAGELEHRVTEVVGNNDRVAFAGWFREGAPDFLSRLAAADTAQEI